MIVYKVVKRMIEDDTLVSAMASCLPGEAIVVYTPGETAYPSLEGSYLFAFETREHALRFTNTCKDVEIWRAEAAAVAMSLSRRRGFLIPSIWDSLRKMQWFWKGLAPGLLSCPHGTVLCSSITLVEQA